MTKRTRVIKRKHIIKRIQRVLLVLSIVTLMIISSLLLTNKNTQGALATEGTTGTVTITVKTGDTLWSLAKAYKGEKDARRFIYEIQVINNLKAPIIYPGQSLEVPSS